MPGARAEKTTPGDELRSRPLRASRTPEARTKRSRFKSVQKNARTNPRGAIQKTKDRTQIRRQARLAPVRFAEQSLTKNRENEPTAGKKQRSNPNRSLERKRPGGLTGKISDFTRNCENEPTAGCRRRLASRQERQGCAPKWPNWRHQKAGLPFPLHGVRGRGLGA